MATDPFFYHAQGTLFDDRGRCFGAKTRTWHASDVAPPAGAALDAISAATWLQRESAHPLRVPIGVIGPRDATLEQLALAEDVGRGLARMGFTVMCGGRHGVMEAVCRGATAEGGITLGMLPDTDPSLANPYVGVIVATGIGEARNALIARAAFCLVAIGDSFGTLSEVALGRQFGKTVIGLADAADVDGVIHVDNARSALTHVAMLALGHTSP
jgi:uncharacterized protein (TIGR00725 family)